MYPSETEIRYTIQSYPQGGVAPSRHALARHAYIERQKRWALRSSSVSAAAVFGPVLSTVINRATILLNRIGAFWTDGRRAPRDKDAANDLSIILGDCGVEAGRIEHHAQ